MRVVWQSSRENSIGQTGVKRARQRVAKGLVAESAPAERGIEDAGGPGGAGGTGEPPPAARDLEEPAPATRGTREPAPAAGDPDGGGETGKPAPVAALLSSWSDCWRALALAAVCFRCCFSFFNCLFFS